MLQKKQFIKRCALDRRSSLDRRILNLGPVYPGKEKRTKKVRRKGWEDRLGWTALDRYFAPSKSFETFVDNFVGFIDELSSNVVGVS